MEVTIVYQTRIERLRQMKGINTLQKQIFMLLPANERKYVQCELSTSREKKFILYIYNII